jgi:PAS domain S-box-containing protein
MSLILSFSILIRIAAFVWSIVLLRRLSDWRMAFLSAMLALMALRQTLTLVTTIESAKISATAHAIELPGLVVSVLAFIAVVFLGKIIGERHQANQALATRAHQQQELAELGRRALSDTSINELMNHTVSLVHETLQVDYVKILELLPGNKALLLRAGVGWRNGCVGSATVETGIESQAGYTLQSLEPVVVLNLPGEPRFSGPPLLLEHGVVSGASVVIGSIAHPFGVLGVHTTERRSFSEDDINFLQAIANLIGEAVARRSAEEDLRVKDTALEASISAIVLTDAETNIFYVNRAFLEMWGYDSREEIVGRPGSDLESVSGEVRLIVKALRKEGHWIGEVSPMRKDGSSFDALVSAQVIRDQSGGVSFLMSSFVDISQLKRAELEHEKLREQFFQAQKLESIGALAGGIAHDFNNLLTVILGCTEIVLKHVEKDSGGYEAATDVLHAGERAADLTRQLLAFSRKQPLSPRMLDLNSIVSELKSMLARLIGERNELSVSLDSEIGSVSADSTQLEQVIMNLVVNAHDAMPDGGTVHISTGRVSVLPRDCISLPEDAGESYIRLSISDTGEGMNDETAAQIFEPFFTTKRPGQGTGLGLSTVFGIISQSGGTMRVQSALGQGSTFDIFLPEVHMTTALDAAESDRHASRDQPHGQSKTVLLVEDDHAIRKLARSALESDGHLVLAAVDGPEALKVSREYTGEIDILLTDVVMPGMTGVDLARELAEERPGIETVYMSAYANRSVSDRLHLPTDACFLAKPFSLRELKELVAKHEH